MRWIADNVTKILWGLLLSIIGFLSVWGFTTVQALEREAVRRDELYRIEQKIDRLDKKIDQKFDLLIRLTRGGQK